MHRSILFILCLAIIHLNHACYITNCPIGGKRNLHFDNNLHNHQCPRCGLNGQCFGPSICCTGLACRIGNPSDIRQCSLEDRNVIPCEIKTTICSALPNGRCAANGVCCGIAVNETATKYVRTYVRIDSLDFPLSTAKYFKRE
ncbi:unnamed protein product [Rotaria sp. Silwood1]|nr:unnamed protein product [Rotaria sp. Silwood1]CAF1055179.1 unnamed protein product [Rotaria sp. Silwood1]CAF1261122.1 unnamed protein product [Rotaria sp. Silwood1]CAF3460940.1 unnamed protein product [Rotaria sp. Silwood1]CAF3531670.1 unnamed protein product [Rotaria sp. Silwood1]